jgi:integrase
MCRVAQCCSISYLWFAACVPFSLGRSASAEIDAAYKGRAGLHAFRHSLATVLITEEQVDPKTAQGILRHASSDITMDIYTHAQDDAKRKALEKFEARLVQ